MAPLTIVLILIITYVTYLFLDNDEDGNEGKELNAEFLISDSSPSSGGLVTLDANFKEQGSKCEWTIFPEYHVVTHLSPMQDSVKLYFKRAGTYRVDLRISYEGKTATTFKFIDVTERIVLVYLYIAQESRAGVTSFQQVVAENMVLRETPGKYLPKDRDVVNTFANV